MTKLSNPMTPKALGLDIGDRNIHLCAVDADGNVLERDVVPTREVQIRRRLSRVGRCKVVLEAGSQSPWLSRTLADMGFEVLVADPRRVQLITKDPRKTDRRDAEMLALLALGPKKLLGEVHHRSEQAQADLAVIKARAALVESRTAHIQLVRAQCKLAGSALPSSATRSFPANVANLVPEHLRPALEPLLETIRGLTASIYAYDKLIEKLCDERYRETALLRQVHGVGPITALCFVLTLERPQRFADSQRVGSWLGLCPKSHASGDSAPQLSISRAGNPELRRLLVQCAHYILGPFGKPSDLRSFGERLVARGGRASKKKAVVAVARKLAVLLHRLWSSQAAYDPHYSETKKAAVAAVAN